MHDYDKMMASVGAAGPIPEAAIGAYLASKLSRIEEVEGLFYHLKDGESPELLLDLLDKPVRLQQRVRLESLDSFRVFVGKFVVPDTVIFASCENMRLEAVFDYHASTKANWRQSRAEFTLAFDERYERWAKHFDEWISQETFIELLERNETSMISPTSAAMLEIATALDFNIRSRVTSKKNPRNGAFELTFESDEGGDQSTVIPERITLGLPIYKGLLNDSGKRIAHTVDVKIRYRLRDGAVRFQLAPVNLDDILADAWADVVETVHKWGLAPVFEGQDV